MLALAGGGIVALGLVLLATNGDIRKRLRPSGDDEPGAPGNRRTDYPTLVETPPRHPAPETPEETEKEVASVMTAWRNSIQQRDADSVLRLDATFRDEPARYASALSESAKSDPDPHVRAFSTRMIGKLRRPDLAGLFGELLADPSPYVRQNAAWALGELAGAANGRSTVEPARAVLRRAGTRDPDGKVRLAARGALDRLQ